MAWGEGHTFVEEEEGSGRVTESNFWSLRGGSARPVLMLVVDAKDGLVTGIGRFAGIVLGGAVVTAAVIVPLTLSFSLSFAVPTMPVAVAVALNDDDDEDEEAEAITCNTAGTETVE